MLGQPAQEAEQATCLLQLMRWSIVDQSIVHGQLRRTGQALSGLMIIGPAFSDLEETNKATKVWPHSISVSATCCLTLLDLLGLPADCPLMPYIINSFKKKMKYGIPGFARRD